MNPADRRDFTKLSFLAAAATAFLIARADAIACALRRSRLGRHFEHLMQACAESTRCKVTALVTGHAAQKAPKYEIAMFERYVMTLAFKYHV